MKTLTKQEIINNPSILVGKFEIFKQQDCLIINFYYKKEDNLIFYFRKLQYYKNKKIKICFDCYNIEHGTLEVSWPKIIHIL